MDTDEHPRSATPPATPETPDTAAAVQPSPPTPAEAQQVADDPEAMEGDRLQDGVGGVDRGALILQGLRSAAAWAWRFLLVVAALAVIFYLIGKIWVGVLPIIMALLVSSVLWPPVRWLRAHGWPPGAAAAVVLILALAVFGGIIAGIAPGVGSQARQVADNAAAGLDILLNWLAGPPLNLENDQLNDYVSRATGWLESRASDLASGAVSTIATVGSILVTTALVLVLTFFFLKDGARFLPWLRRTVGRTAGLYLTEALARVWITIGGFLRAQAGVAAIDALLIGLGLFALKVPLAFALAVITFFLSFIPIIGAVIAGALAVLVALVTHGWVTALWVLLIVIAVQQIESTFIAPMLHSRVMAMHPVIVLLGVAAGGTLWGILGAFLAVPVLASFLTLLRYGSQHLDLRTGEAHVDDVIHATPEGRSAALLAESSAPIFALRAQQAYRQAESERGAARVAMLERTSELAASLRDRIFSPIRRRDRSDDVDVAGGVPGEGEDQPPRL